MGLRIVAGSAHPALARHLERGLHCPPTESGLEHFPDGELRPVVGPLRGDDVYVVQPTCSPVNEHLVELLLLIDACRRAGSGRVTAVVPYFGYARQDRRTCPGEGIGARVAADAIAGAGADRLVVVDPHSPGFESMCTIPVVALTALPVLADALGQGVLHPGVVVAPDIGALKLAQRLAGRLGLSVAVARKNRITGTTVRSEDLIGEVAGRVPVIVDDMIATGGTIEAAAALLEAGGTAGPPIVVATHGLFVGPAPERLLRVAPARLLATDSVPPRHLATPLEVCSVAPLLVEAIGRLHRDEALDELVAWG